MLSANGIQFQIGPSFKTHGQIWVDGIPFTDQSTLYALRPNAGGRFYGYEDDREIANDAKVEKLPGGGTRAVFPLRAPRGEFMGIQTVEITNDRKLRLLVDGKLTSDTAGKFEHRIGGIFSGWLSGRSYQASGRDGGQNSGSVPTAPSSEDLLKSTVMSDFQKLRIDAATGPIEITTSGALPLSLVDYRKNKYFDGQPLFYIGITERPLKTRASVQYEVTFAFPPVAAKVDAGTTATTNMKPGPVQDAWTPIAAKDIIVPTPRRITWGEGTVAVREGDVLEQLAGNSQQLEHYRIHISDKVQLMAETTAGLAAARHTLQQLERERSGDRVTYRRCEIEDWAAMPFRGIHFFSGAGGADTQTKMITRIMAPLKLNAVIYHCDNIQWDSHPEIKKPGEGMPKKQARLVADAAEGAGVTVVPLINSFGHMNWLLENKHYRHLADNPANPFAYNPTKPEVYQVIDEIFDEAIQLFKPRYFHIGHDEIDLKGFPLDPELQKIGSRKLIRDDIQRWRDWFHQRGVRILIWADMFIGPGESADFTLAPTVEEARLRRDGLPKDVIMCDWHYIADPPANFKSIRILNEAGFDTVASTWYHPRNITNFARAAADARETTSATLEGKPKRGESLGLMQTTWSGSNLNEKTVERAPDQMAAYVVVAEAAWTGGTREPEQLPYNYRHYFSELWLKDLLPKEKRSGWKCEGAVRFGANSIAAGDRNFFTDAWGGGIPLASRFPYHTQLSRPAGLELPINTTATLLLFDVAATAGGPPEPPIAHSAITYDDGTTDGIEWRLGQNVLAIDDDRATPQALYLEKRRVGESHSEIVHRYVMRAASKAIRNISFSSTNQGSGLIVYNVTGVH